MASTLYPEVTSPIKSIQRGVAASAGDIIITSVNVSKSFVNSYARGSAGTVAGTGNTTGTYTPSGGAVGAPGGNLNTNGSFPTYAGTRTLASATGGASDLVTARYGAYLVNSISLTVTGACNWEVIEYI
jgi:hypothetical protein